MAAGSRYATGAVAQVGAPPAAMRVEGGSVGLQIGASETDIVLLVTNDGGMKHLLSDKFTVGGEAQLWQTICRRPAETSNSFAESTRESGTPRPRKPAFRSSVVSLTTCDAPGPPLEPAPVMSRSSFTVPERNRRHCSPEEGGGLRDSLSAVWTPIDFLRCRFQSFSRIEYRFKRPISFAAALGAWTLLVTMSRFSSFLP
jgi:hypothetical protein